MEYESFPFVPRLRVRDDLRGFRSGVGMDESTISKSMSGFNF